MLFQSVSSIRQNLAKTIERIQADQSPIYITRNGEAVAVLISADQFSALQETAYLLSSLPNARRLLDAIEQLES